MSESTERLQRLEQERHAQGPAWRVPPGGEVPQALRGVPWPVAVTLVAALGDLSRFDTPRARMQCLGVIPAEYATGERRRPDSMTKAGPTHTRRARVAGAWAYRDPATVSRQRHLRRAKSPTSSPDLRWQAQGRLGPGSRSLVARGQQATVGIVAMARELVGCRWAMAKEMPGTPSGHKPKRDVTHSSGGCLWA